MMRRYGLGGLTDEVFRLLFFNYYKSVKKEIFMRAEFKEFCEKFPDKVSPRKGRLYQTALWLRKTYWIHILNHLTPGASAGTSTSSGFLYCLPPMRICRSEACSMRNQCLVKGKPTFFLEASFAIHIESSWDITSSSIATRTLLPVVLSRSAIM